MHQCFICKAPATHFHSVEDCSTVRIRFCKNCFNAAELRDAELTKNHLLKVKTHLVVDGVQGCQIRPDKIVSVTKKLKDVTCRRCLMALYYFGSPLSES